MKNFSAIFFLALMPFFAVAQTNVVENAVPTCQIDGNPNLNTDYNTIDESIQCSTMKDTNNGDFYTYDSTLPLGTRWVKDGDDDATNEIQDADAVNITSGTFNGQDVQTALEAVNTAATTPDGDDDATNEIQDADAVNITSGTFNGQDVETALETLNTAANTADGDGDAANELQDFSIDGVSGAQDVRVLLENSPNGSRIDIVGGDGITVTPGGNNRQGVATITIAELPEYISNAAAVAGEGLGVQYRVSQGSTEGSRGAVKVTY